jgi:hypothetical protein
MGGRQSAEVACDVEGHILHRICLVTVRLFSSLLSCLWPTTSSNKHSSLFSQPFAFLSFHSSLLPPTHFVRESHLLSHSIAGSSPPFPASLRLASHHDHRACTECSPTLGRSCFVRRRCCGALCAKRGGFLGSLKLCRCVCVSIWSLLYLSHMK